MSTKHARTLVRPLLCVVLASCSVSDEDAGGPPLTGGLTNPEGLGTTGLRRLDRFEVLASVKAAFGVSADELATLLPDDLAGTNPFANDYEAQTISSLVIGSYAAFAQAYAQKLATTGGLAQQIGQCTPAKADDAPCFRAIASVAGRRMFRHALTSDELDTYTAAILPEATSTGDFNTAVEMLVELLVQHPRFLYRIERGSGALDDNEIATRMAFLLWGAGPDDELLDAADAGQLQEANVRVHHARRMLDDPRAQANLHRFHAEWLGFSAAPLPAAIAADLEDETAHLIDRVVFEKDGSWLDLFNWPETYVTPALATQYAFPSQSTPGWTSYPANRGGGVLAHGSFLALGAKFGDTSPTVRGNEIYKRITCGQLPPLPASIDTDTPPGDPSQCKPERYVMRTTSGCDSCHATIDNIGFGLENFGVFGQWRDVEPNKPQCAIAAAGTWNGNAFAGTKELGALIASDPQTSACATRQLFRFVAGRDERSDDVAMLEALDTTYKSNTSLRNLLTALVESPAIAYRKGN